ncbi:MAG: DUF7033 domain-containing protein [Thermoleophilia bacterium]
MSATDPRGGLPVYIEAPDGFAAKAAWALTTTLTAVGARVRVVRDPAQAGACALAYAPAPVAGVPTLPRSDAALDLVAARRPLRDNAFAAFPAAHESLGGEGAHDVVGAFPAPAGLPAAAGFAVPFDLVASAFVLLASWDEYTSSVRDRYGRFPYEESVFACNAALGPRALVDPPLDGYALRLGELLAPRLAELGLAPLPRLGWGGASGGDGAEDVGDAQGGAGGTTGTQGDGRGGDAAFAVALTHDVDILRRWTARGRGGAAHRGARAARLGEFARARSEACGLGRALVYDLPQGIGPTWTFPGLLEREDRLGATSTFFLIASHHADIDGPEPDVYRERLPLLAHLLREHHREVGLHGNERDRDDPAALSRDRDTLGKMTGAAIDGMRYHYLRCLYHETLPLLDAQGFLYDTSLAFGEHEGYRCGFSHPFHPYDLAADRPLALVELPLVVMDSTLQERHYRSLAAPEAREAALAALQPLVRSGGAAALLWHHNRFDPRAGHGYGQVYWDLLDWIAREGGVATSARTVVERWRRRTGEATS